MPAKRKPKPEVAPQPKTTTVVIFGDLPNPAWKRATDSEGNAVLVQVPNRLKDKLLGKRIEVVRIDEMPSGYYKYEP